MPLANSSMHIHLRGGCPDCDQDFAYGNGHFFRRIRDSVFQETVHAFQWREMVTRLRPSRKPQRWNICVRTINAAGIPEKVNEYEDIHVGREGIKNNSWAVGSCLY